MKSWLNSQDAASVELAITYLRWQLHQHADRVAELVEPFESRLDWRPRFQSLVERGDLEKGRRYFELVFRLLKSGILDDAKAPFYPKGGFWTTVAGLAEAKPVWAAELGACWLDSQIARALASSGSPRAGVQLDDDSGINDLALAAQNAPTAILDHVLPAVLRAIEALPSNLDNEGLKGDSAWSDRFYSDAHDLSEAYLQAVKTAFASVSSDSPETLRPFIDDLKKREFDTVNTLLFSAYQCHPQHFADEALAVLVADPRRFHNALHGSSYWIACCLIKTCSPHCSKEIFRELESVVVKFVSINERTGDGYRYYGQAAFTLASALDPERILDTTKTKLISWREKLGDPEGPPVGIRAYSVRSPINEEKASHMTDEHWLRAMGKYLTRDHDPSDYSIGGADQLASILGTFVAKDPGRFGALAHQFPVDPEPNYLRAVLRNLKDAEIPGTDKIAVARLVFSWPPSNAASSALDLLGSINDTLLPTDAVDFIRLMAFDGPGPTGSCDRVSSDDNETVKDIRIDGLNTIRGNAIESIARLVLHDHSYLAHYGADIEKLSRDSSSAVRACAAFAVYAMAVHDSARALALLPAFFETDVSLHSSEFVCRLIDYGVREHLDTVRPFIHLLLDSTNLMARRRGGIAACLAHLYHSKEAMLAETALTGSVKVRLGATAVAESNLLNPTCRPWCEQALRRLFDDSDEEVRNAAAHCFWHLWQKPNYPLTDYSDLIDAFLKSSAFTTDPSFLLHALDDTMMRLPEQVLLVCETFVDRCADDVRDIRKGIAGDEHTVGRLVFRAVAQLSEIVGQRRAVTLIDRMCLEGLNSASKHLGEFER